MQESSILITGCSTGIGYQAAIVLASRGYQVFAGVKQVKDLALFENSKIIGLHLDLRSQQSIEVALDKVLAMTGGTLDYLFNNGAYGQPAAIEDLPTEVLREQFETNVFGWHHLTRLVLKVMRKQGHGRIVQNSSVLGFVAMRFRGAYNASKYAIEGLTDTLRLELTGSKIKVCLIEPGPIDTNFRATALEQLNLNIQWQKSVHIGQYNKQIERLQQPGTTSGFTLPAQAVVACLIKALEDKKPKLRYRVTFPSKLFAVLKRIFSARLLDRFLAKG